MATENWIPELDGLWPLAASARGKYLLVSDDPALIESLFRKLQRKSDREPAHILLASIIARARHFCALQVS